MSSNPSDGDCYSAGPVNRDVLFKFVFIQVHSLDHFCVLHPYQAVRCNRSGLSRHRLRLRLRIPRRELTTPSGRRSSFCANMQRNPLDPSLLSLLRHIFATKLSLWLSSIACPESSKTSPRRLLSGAPPVFALPTPASALSHLHWTDLLPDMLRQLRLGGCRSCQCEAVQASPSPSSNARFEEVSFCLFEKELGRLHDILARQLTSF